MYKQEIDKLEKAWHRYRLKRHFVPKIALGSILLLSVVGLVIYVGPKHTIEKSEQASLHVDLPVHSNKEQNPSSGTLLLSPAFHTILTSSEVSEHTIAKRNEAPVKQVLDIPVLDPQPYPKKDTAGKISLVDPKPNMISHKKRRLKIEIVDDGKMQVYGEIEARFRSYKDPYDALFLAKAYFKKGLYAKAEYWALQVNKLAPQMEDGWIVFAKSKLKQGKINEAIEVLRLYVQKSGSSKARALLKKLGR